MNYTFWEDSDGIMHEISEMDAKYIKSCIKCIENMNFTIYSEENSNSDKKHYIFGPWWCYEHANRFLGAFNLEMAIRKRGKDRNYPQFYLKESCDNCDKLTCERNQICNEWMLNNTEIFHQFSGENLEVARRFGYYCNDVKYEYEE